MTGAVIATLVIALIISVAFNAFALGWVSGHKAVEDESSEESSESPPAMGFRQDPDEDDEDQGD